MRGSYRQASTSVSVLYLVLVTFCLQLLTDSYVFYPRLRSPNIYLSTRLNNYNNIVWEDVSPLSDGGIIKTVVTPGDVSKGKPAYGDTVTIILERSDAKGNVIPVRGISSREDLKVTFGIGQDADIFDGIHYGVLHMAIGEVARLDITPKYSIPTLEQDVSCLVTLLDVEPHIEVEDPDDIHDVRSRNAANINRNSAEQFQTQMDRNGGNNPLAAELLKSTTKEVGSETRTPVFYDPSRHKLDPRRDLDGEAYDHSHTWHETPDTIEIYVPLPSSIKSKQDVVVEIKKTAISIRCSDAADNVVLEGPLYGYILPSGSFWALEENIGGLFMTGLRAVLHLEKAYGHTELWGSVFNREYLMKKQKK